RMYARKQGRSSGAREQAQDVLVHIMRAKQSSLPEHADGVARLAVAVGRRLALGGEQLDLLARATSAGTGRAIRTACGARPSRWRRASSRHATHITRSQASAATGPPRVHG